jgi:hypothetical protein
VTSKRQRFQHLALGLTAVLLFTAAGPLRVWLAHGDRLGARSVQLSESRASSTATYNLSFTGQSGGTVGSIRAQFCANDPLIGTSCTPPAGFDVSGAALASQTGMTGFTIDPVDTTTNTLVLTRVPGAAPAGNSAYTLTGVTNPSTEGSYYIRLETFASIDASGGNVDYGGLAFAIGNALNVSTYVPPYLLFCAGTTLQPYDCSTASGDYIDFGEFSASKTSTGQTKMLVATNADGYTIRVMGTTLTSGNNEIPALATNDVSRTGISQFGLNLRANATPQTGSNVQGAGSGVVASNYNTTDFYRFNSGEIVASSPVADDYRLYTASYVVNISKQQPPGVYISTITYVGLANF